MPPQKTPDLSLVLACYNESSHIEKSVAKIIETLEGANFSYEIIFYDDKSKDDTASKIKKIIKQYPHTVAYFHPKNVGRGGTVRDGILAAKGKVVGFIDIDCEVSNDYVPHFYREIISGKDMTIASRYYPMLIWPPNTLVRTILSEIYAKVVRQLLNLGIKDPEAGYKFFNREKILPVLAEVQDIHWFWDTEIVARGRLRGLSISELPVLFLRNADKQSTVRLIPDIIAYFKALSKLEKSLLKEFNPPGLLYHFPPLYGWVMRLLFGNNYANRYSTIANFIPKKASVTDVCCGDGMLFSYLLKKDVNYHGLDISQAFVRWGLKRQIPISLADVTKDPIPPADYVILQGSLYQFAGPRALITKLHKATKKALIISESVHHIQKSFIGKIFPGLITTLVGTNQTDQGFRFSEKSFKEILSTYQPKYLSVNGGRDLIAIIQKS